MLDAERDAHEIRETGEEGVNHIKNWRDEKKGELDRLGDPGEKSGERGRDHDAPDLPPLLGTRGTPHRDRRGRQAPHLKKITAGHVACRWVPCDEAGDFALHDTAGGGI